MKVKVSDEPTLSNAWWATPAAGWSDVSDDMFKHWHRFERSMPKLDDDVAMTAMAFGYGARSVYGEHMVWADLAVLLEADWRQLDGVEHPWADVQRAVKKGWAGSANTDPIHGESMVAEPLPMEQPVETNVPGGRLDRHTG